MGEKKGHLLPARDVAMQQAVGEQPKQPPSPARGSSEGLRQELCVRTHIIARRPSPIAREPAPPAPEPAGAQGRSIPACGAASVLSVTTALLQQALPGRALGGRENRWAMSEQRGREK